MTRKLQPQRKLGKPRIKIEKIIALLSREDGATLDDLCNATDWQKQTVRASLTGLRKKGDLIERAKVDDLCCYVITQEAGK